MIKCDNLIDVKLISAVWLFILLNGIPNKLLSMYDDI